MKSSSSTVFHFVAPCHAKDAEVLAGKEFETVQRFIKSPDILYRHEQVQYKDIWEKTAHPEKPDVLHLVAHGTDGRLMTANTYLSELSVDAHLFAKDAKEHLGNRLQHIYLGVCDSAALGQALAREGFTVLCFEGKVNPEQGICFAENFYKFFAQAKNDFYAAYCKAKNTWKANGYHQAGVMPRFYCAESGGAYAWNKDQYQNLLRKLWQAKQPGLLSELFDELQLDTAELEPFDLPSLFRYLKDKKALFLLRDRAEAYFLEYPHAYTEAFKDFEEGLLKPCPVSPPPAQFQECAVIEASQLEYKRSLLKVMEPKKLTKKGIEQLAEKLILPLNLDINRIKSHLLGTVPSLKVGVVPDSIDAPAMLPQQFISWMLRQPNRYFILQGAAASGKTTFLADAVKAHFMHHTDKKVFIARFSSLDWLNAQLKEWKKDAVGNILILDALNEAFDDPDTILQLLAESNRPVRVFSKVILGFRDTFLKANQPLKKAIDTEDWTVLRMAPLEMADVQHYLRKCFPVSEQDKYAVALKQVKIPNATPPELREGVTPFVLYHVAFLTKEGRTGNSTALWDVMNQLANKMMPEGNTRHFFKKKVLEAYQQGGVLDRLIFTESDMEDIGQPSHLPFLSKKQDKNRTEYYTFAHSNFKDYILAQLLFEGRICEIDFDKERYPDAYQLYQDYCWRKIHPQGHSYEFDPVVASALPCFAFQVMHDKHEGELPLKYPSISQYFRAVFEDWDAEILAKLKQLAEQQATGQEVAKDLEALCRLERDISIKQSASSKQYLVWRPNPYGDEAPPDLKLEQVVDTDTYDFRHPLYRDVLAFLHRWEQGREAALAFIDQSPFGWLFRHERIWLEYGEYSDAFSLVYPVKDEDSSYSILFKAAGKDLLTDFDNDIFQALQTPAMLERYYPETTRLHIQVHTSALPAQILNVVPFPEQIEELSIGGDAALEGEWNLGAFKNLEVLDLSPMLDIGRLSISKCPPLLETIIHPGADLLPVAEPAAGAVERITQYLKDHWTAQAPDTPLPPEVVQVEGGAFEMGAGWFEALQAREREVYGKEIPDFFKPMYPPPVQG